MPARLNELAEILVDAVTEVRHVLGVGLLESTYKHALAHELELRGVRYTRESRWALSYKGVDLPGRIQPDFVIEDLIVVEAKAVEQLHPAHHAQLLTYLTQCRMPLGFLVNFHAVPMRDGILRRVNRRAFR